MARDNIIYRKFQSSSELTLGNKAFREERYVDAITCYKNVLNERPELEKFVTFNYNLAQKKLNCCRHTKNYATTHDKSTSTNEVEQIRIKEGNLDQLNEFQLNLYTNISNHEIDWSGYFTENKHPFVSDDPIVDYICNWIEYSPTVPNFFDTEFYTKVYPDIEREKVNPLWHYIKSGINEGRKGRWEEDKIVEGSRKFDFTKETLIFVHHESSTTGAPLLGYNIVSYLVKKYNVINIVIRNGNISESFVDNCCLLFSETETSTYYNSLFFIKKIQEECGLSCVILNSIECRSVGGAAHRLGLPVVFLIHEFYEYTRPLGAMAYAVTHSDMVVVPATIIKESIQEELKKVLNCQFTPKNISISPQGKLPYIPDGYGEDVSVETLCKRFGLSSTDEANIIVGAGWVQMRKGVDLFVKTAKYVKRLFKGKCIFVWVGEGFEPDFDIQYSTYLKREIDYSGLEDDFIMLEHQKSLDTIFSITDVFCLTSRMDPFPNVIADALSHNLHIACFENATGASEFLQKNNADCTVAEYLDCYDLARGIVSYFEQSSKNTISHKELVNTKLGFDNYIGQLNDHINKAIEFKVQSKYIIDRLIKSGEFDSEFYGAFLTFYGDLGTPGQRLRLYVENGLKGIHVQRNPKPGFSDGLWLTENSGWEASVVPLYEALQNGKCETHTVVHLPCPVKSSIDFTYAVHVHLFYPDMADFFASYFQHLPGVYDLLITTVKGDLEEEIHSAFSCCDAREIKVVEVTNIGRDSGPLLFDLKEHILNGGYELIGHFHSKKSMDNMEGLGNRWLQYILDNLVGDARDAYSVLSLFNEPHVGLVFPEDSHTVDIGRNKTYIHDLCEMLGLPPLEDTPLFPVGNMFWARVEAIKDLFDLDKDAVLEPEPLPYDGSYMHAIERITPHLIKQRKYSIRTVFKKGTTW